MKRIVMTVSALALTAGAATAGGITRSGQSLGVLFEEGRYAELSLGSVNPDVSGNDLAMFGGGSSGSVADRYSQLAFSYKYDINEKLSFAIVLDQPFGADVEYAASSVALGGTIAKAKSTALTGLMRYKFSDAFSVHGGVRAQKSSAQVTLRGAAYRNPATPTVAGSGFDGYNVDLAQDTALGYVVGVAYEKPEIALRVALTYNSAITHNFDTVETLGGGVIGIRPTEVETPQSVSLDFQTGVAKDTLVFGQIRWEDWSAFKLNPTTFTSLSPGGLIDLVDTTTYTIGVGRRFNENWAGSISFSYEGKDDPLVSPLAPTDGKKGVTIAAVYTKDNMKITTGINYTKLGDATPETGTPDVARATFADNSALGIGVRVGFSF